MQGLVNRQRRGPGPQNHKLGGDSLKRGETVKVWRNAYQDVSHQAENYLPIL